MDAAEAERRQNFKQAVERYFRDHPNEWISASTLMLIGGRMAWRTRVSDARKVFRKEDGQIENRFQRVDGAVLSEYRYTAHTPAGRDSTVVGGSLNRRLF